jgi:hypothetical protein
LYNSNLEYKKRKKPWPHLAGKSLMKFIAQVDDWRRGVVIINLIAFGLIIPAPD